MLARVADLAGKGGQPTIRVQLLQFNYGKCRCVDAFTEDSIQASPLYIPTLGPGLPRPMSCAPGECVINHAPYTVNVPLTDIVHIGGAYDTKARSIPATTYNALLAWSKEHVYAGKHDPGVPEPIVEHEGKEPLAYMINLAESAEDYIDQVDANGVCTDKIVRVTPTIHGNMPTTEL